MTRKIEISTALSDDALEDVAGGGLKNAISFGLAGAKAGARDGVAAGPVGIGFGGFVGGLVGAIGGAFTKDDPKASW